jgi:hypothetical protein
VTYSIRVHSEADAEHARTIAWLTAHVSAHHAIAYAAAISIALDEILERPLACQSRDWRGASWPDSPHDRPTESLGLDEECGRPEDEWASPT